MSKKKRFSRDEGERREKPTWAAAEGQGQKGNIHEQQQPQKGQFQKGQPQQKGGQQQQQFNKPHAKEEHKGKQQGQQRREEKNW